MTWAGADTEAVASVTTMVVLASVLLLWPVTYLTSYSPGSSGTLTRAGLPVAVYAKSVQAPSAAPAGTTVMKSPGLSGPSQATSISLPPTASAGALTDAVTA